MTAPTPKAPGNLFALLGLALIGLLPFGAGTLLAGVAGFPIRPGVFLGGAGAVIALILAAWGSRGAFAPHSGRWPDSGRLSPARARMLAYGAVGLAAVLGIVLQFWARTGNWTIPLGGLGLLGGYFSFAPPFKWHRRGWGEALAGLCFGFLPVTAGYYLQTGHLITEILLYALPLTFAGFNLFLVHGFPPLQGEAPEPRYSLAARVGPVAAALIFTLVNILTIVGLVFDLLFPAFPLPCRWGFILMILLAVVNQELVKQKAYRREARISLLCRLTLALQLGMGLVFVISLWQRG
jgi:1,4-dihydroxy-2-naphthoate octaprenyltransferase